MDNEPHPITPPQSPADIPNPVDAAKSKGPSNVIIIVGSIAGIVLVIAAGWLIAYTVSKHQAPKPVQKSSASSAATSAPATNDANQAYARNTKRRTDMLSLQTQLEAFFEGRGYYPSLADMNSPGWRAVNMKNIDAAGTMVDPSSNCNPSTDACLVASPKKGAYAYAVSDDKGKSCESNDTACAKYTLTATYENTVDGASTYSVTNLD